MLTRRSLLSSGAAGVASVTLAACATTIDPTTGATTYGLSPATIAFIQNAVSLVKQYVPTLESIAGTAASLFGPQFAAVVSVGSAAINAVINTLIDLVPGAAPTSLKMHRFGLQDRALGRRFVGWTATHVPVYAQ